MAQSLPPTEPFLLPCVCESANLGQSQPPHTIPPPPGAPVSENVPECFPAAPDSPCGGESLFSCFFLLSVLLIFLFSAPPRAPCGERLLGETSLQQGESKPVQGSPPGRVHICRTAN